MIRYSISISLFYTFPRVLGVPTVNLLAIFNGTNVLKIKKKTFPSKAIARTIALSKSNRFLFKTDNINLKIQSGRV